VRLWVDDFKYSLGRALRAVGVGLAAVGWASVLASEAQQYNDLRWYALVAAAIVSVLATQFLAGLPPSARPRDVARDMERDIQAVAREQAPTDPERQTAEMVRIGTLAVERLRTGANVPKDRRAWLRALASLPSDA
jgi:hypothetical protein